MIDITKIEIRPSPIFALAQALPFIGLSIGTLFLAAYFHPILSIIAIVFIGIAFYKYAYIRMILYTITSETLTVRTGIILKRVDHLELYRVQDYIILQPLLMQIFKLMNVQLITADKLNGSVRLTGIPLSNIVDTIRQFVQDARANNRIFETI